jgi:LAGLIDADG DNA endonuclease family
MSDGYINNNGLALATNSFSIYENEVLVNALNNKFKFTSRIIKDHDKPSIFIPSKNLICLQILVLDYMHPTLLYKFYL